MDSAWNAWEVQGRLCDQNEKRIAACFVTDEGDALYGHGGGMEPHNQAPADEGGGADEVPPDGRDAAQYSWVQIQVSGAVHRHVGRADPVQAQHGTGCVPAPKL